MAITVKCDCGKRTIVSDALAGKMMRCPGCGNEVAAAANAGGKRGAKAGRSGPALEISGGQKLLLGSVGGVLLLGAGFYFGPMQVWSKWKDLQPKAAHNIQDLVMDSLKEHMKNEDLDPMDRRRQPVVETADVNFFEPYLAFSMPDTIAFIGKSNQGTFSGNYNLHTGEIDATVYYGGYSVAGMVDVKRPKGSFHLVGHMAGDKPDMEIDGKKI